MTPTASWLSCAEQTQPHNLSIPHRHKNRHQSHCGQSAPHPNTDPGWAYKRDAAASRAHVYQALRALIAGPLVLMLEQTFQLQAVITGTIRSDQHAIHCTNLASLALAALPALLGRRATSVLTPYKSNYAMDDVFSLHIPCTSAVAF